ncbi:MAG: gamma-glutamyltransferase [Snowella sp.]|nr:gamma-glutamyltransferase [Snowella sp.]
MAVKTKGVIAAGHPKTAEAGRLMLELGGNAFDAAIAAVFAAFVVESTLTSAGGGGFLLAHTEDHQDLLFDFFCQTPRYPKPLFDIEFYPVELNFGGALQIFHIGKGAIAVPGALAGAFTVHQRLGKLPFTTVIEPAIDYARNGFILNSFNEFTHQLLEPILLGEPEGQELYAPSGKLLEQGDISYHHNFAQTLTYLAEKGIQDFYQGDIAHQIVKDLSSGGYLTLEDLQAYEVIVRKPLKLNYRGYELLTNPPPSSGGTLIAFALKLLESLDLKQLEWGSAEHLTLLSQVMRCTNTARKNHYDEAIYQASLVEEFLSPANCQTYQQELQGVCNKLGSTTHISVMDDLGNAASVTTSNGEGSSYIVPGTGIMLNNMLGEADLNPQGFHHWQPNQRLSSMMSPTLVLKNGRPEMVLGSGGSNRIRTAILQVISNCLDFDLPIAIAVNRSRIHWENQTLDLEPLNCPEVLNKLVFADETRINLWDNLNMFFGGVHATRLSDNGELEGVGDPRRSGVAIYS